MRLPWPSLSLQRDGKAYDLPQQSCSRTLTNHGRSVVYLLLSLSCTFLHPLDGNFSLFSYTARPIYVFVYSDKLFKEASRDDALAVSLATASM